MNNDNPTNLPQLTDDVAPLSQQTDAPLPSDVQSDNFIPQPDPVMTQDMSVLQNQVISLPAEANDLDVIEKEWVVQLKNVVSHTSQDPFSQQAEISKVKADYMQKRYNKDVKVAGK